MSIYSREINAIKHLQNKINPSDIFFCTKSLSTKRMFQTVYNKKKWDSWIDNSNASAAPPDFFSDKYHYMLEVMRIDDHGHLDEKGRIINPTTRSEGEIERELHKKNPHLWASYVSPLPTDDDHRFEWYFENFKRIVQQHCESIPLYQRNHPGYKLIFFIIDESSMYYERSGSLSPDDTPLRETDVGRPHGCYLDKAFLDVLYSTGANYCIWLTPYKRMFGPDVERQLNCAYVFDLSKAPSHALAYNHDAMCPCEVNPLDGEIKVASERLLNWLINRDVNTDSNYIVKCVNNFRDESNVRCFVFKYKNSQSKKWRLSVVNNVSVFADNRKFYEKSYLQDAKQMMRDLKNNIK